MADPFATRFDLMPGNISPYTDYPDGYDPTDALVVYSLPKLEPTVNNSNAPQDQSAALLDPSALQPSTDVGILGPVVPPSASSPTDAGRYYLPGVGVTNLDPDFADKIGSLILAAQRDNIPLSFSQGYRDQAGQNLIKNDPTAITPANESLHSTGDAADVHISRLTPAMLSKLVSDAAAAGISWGGNFSKPDPVHFYSDPGGNRSQRIDNFSRAIQNLRNQIPDD